MAKKKAKKTAKKKIKSSAKKLRKKKASLISKTAKKAKEREERRKIREAEAELEFEPDEEGEVSAKLIEQEFTGTHILESEKPSRSKCAQCGKAIDADLAIERRVEGNIAWFCSNKCGDVYEEEHSF
ncbi:MAG: hypothetical protein QW331_03975 [Candidatus Woesearchaeota archaeon]